MIVFVANWRQSHQDGLARILVARITACTYIAFLITLALFSAFVTADADRANDRVLIPLK